jgi:CubicO group peptidase (beta-lactamase class C family)
VASESPQFEPGTRWAYSNTGFLLLGAVIEKVTGESYFDHVRKRVFEPAGMTATDSYEMDRPTPNLAIGYVREFGDGGASWKNNSFEHVIKGGPAGGGYSTVHDLLKFAVALRSGKLLDAAHRDLVLSAKPEMHSPNYGFGFGVRTGTLGRVVGHSGGFVGISSNLDVYLDAGLTVVVLSNCDGGAQAAGRKIRDLFGDAD